MKIQCTKCNKQLEDIDKNFRRFKSGAKFGKRKGKVCRECETKDRKEYYIENIESQLQYCQNNKKQRSYNGRRWYEDHSEELQQKRIEEKEDKQNYDKSYYVKNEKKVKQNRKRRAKEIKEYGKMYYIVNKEKIKRYTKKRMAENPEQFLEFAGRKREAWRQSIYKKFNYMCQACRTYLPKKNGLNAHHIFPKSDFPNLKYNLDNGICLCKDCHKDFHKKFGQNGYF